MVIKGRYKFVSKLNISRCLILLFLLLVSSSCSSERIERKGDRGDCSDITDGISDDEFFSLRWEQEVTIDHAHLIASLKSWNGTTRYKALLSLILQTEPHTILTTLMTTVQDEDPRVREASIEGLAMAAQSQDKLIPQILPILTQAMQDEDPGVRAATIDGLTQVAQHQKTLTPQVFPLLENGLKDRSACVRASSASFIKDLIFKSEPHTNELKLVIPDLIVVASSDSSVWARLYALDILGAANVASEEIVPALVMVLKSHPDGTVRTAAASALNNKVTEPESVKALLEAISDQDARVRSSAVYGVLKIEPNLLMKPSNLKNLSDEGLKTSIWMLEERIKDPRGTKDPILNALIAERDSRLQK